jgi:hypothetical protein
MKLRKSLEIGAFDKVKIFIWIEVLLCYPDFNELFPFHLYTDASDYQLGAVIMQDRKPKPFIRER